MKQELEAIAKNCKIPRFKQTDIKSRAGTDSYLFEFRDMFFSSAQLNINVKDNRYSLFGTDLSTLNEDSIEEEYTTQEKFIDAINRYFIEYNSNNEPISRVEKWKLAKFISAWQLWVSPQPKESYLSVASKLMDKIKTSTPKEIGIAGTYVRNYFGMWTKEEDKRDNSRQILEDIKKDTTLPNIDL